MSCRLVEICGETLSLKKGGLEREGKMILFGVSPILALPGLSHLFKQTISGVEQNHWRQKKNGKENKHMCQTPSIPNFRF